MPARYRNELARYDGDQLIAVANELSLEVHPFAAWERLVMAINEQSRFDGEVRRLGRLYVSRAKEVALDGAGRILLPPDARQQAGLVKEVMLVGIGRDFFEVWDRARFEEYERTHGDGLPAGFERLSQLGVK